jgi:lipopolysaccharide transport system ATP-binding protein
LKLEPGEYIFRLRVRLPLRPGSYVVDLAIAEHDTIVDHFVSNVRLKILDDYEGILAPNWKGILNESFLFEHEKID